MPDVYIKADFEILVDLDDVGFLSSQWQSREEEQICDDYGHPKCTINFLLENQLDPIAPAMVFVGDNDAIAGAITVERLNETKYRFIMNGVFKSKIHKDGVKLFKLGVKPKLSGVTRFRHQYFFEQPQLADFEFSLKKLT